MNLYSARVLNLSKYIDSLNKKVIKKSRYLVKEGSTPSDLFKHLPCKGIFPFSCFLALPLDQISLVQHCMRWNPCWQSLNLRNILSLFFPLFYFIEDRKDVIYKGLLLSWSQTKAKRGSDCLLLYLHLSGSE